MSQLPHEEQSISIGNTPVRLGELRIEDFMLETPSNIGSIMIRGSFKEAQKKIADAVYILDEPMYAPLSAQIEEAWFSGDDELARTLMIIQQENS